MSQSAQPNPKFYSDAFGLTFGVVVSALYCGPLYSLTVGYFMQQVAPIAHYFEYPTWRFLWLALIFIAIITCIRCVVVIVMSTVKALMTSLYIRLSLSRQKWR